MTKITGGLRHRGTLIATVGLLVSVLALGLAGFTLTKQTRQAAERAADRKAANTAQVARCYQQIRDAPDVLKTLDLLDTLAQNSIASNRAALDIAPADDPLRPVRKASLARIVPAERALARLIAKAVATVPKEAECDELAARLDVDPAPFKKGSP